ncbi:hypothetical protein [Streptomyces sp. B6B3]|uniref:hypothetical protein n=1 Tax=Streptomyces sp. B6B3 TaxID=3153570 RepID=UPI00325D5C4F
MKGSGHLPVGSLVRDGATDRLGVYLGEGGPFALLRPVCGGEEWTARPTDLRQAVSEYPRPADVEQLRGAYALHVAECETCGPDVACAIGRALSLACQEAMRPDPSAPQSLSASGLLVVPSGEPVPPCPFPCSICQSKGRQ